MLINPHKLSTYLFRELHRHPHSALAHQLIFIVLLAIMIWQEIPVYQFTGWLIVALAGVSAQWLFSLKFHRQAGAASLKPQSYTQYTAATLAAGVGFGITALLLPQLSVEPRYFVIMTLVVVAANGLLKLSVYPSVFLAYLSGLLFPLLYMLILWNGSPGREMIPLIALMGLVMYFLSIQRRKDLLEDLVSKFGLENDAGEDTLTRLANRRRFDITLDQSWAQARRSGIPMSLIMVDIDHFKLFNDTYGHQAGDKCLVLVAKMLSKCARRATDLVGRYGGEEFVILLNETTRDDAIKLAEAMRQAIEELQIENKKAPNKIVTISVGGVTVYADDKQTAASPMKLADIALYRSKSEGRNQVSWYQMDNKEPDASVEFQAG